VVFGCVVCVVCVWCVLEGGGEVHDLQNGSCEPGEPSCDGSGIKLLHHMGRRAQATFVAGVEAGGVGGWVGECVCVHNGKPPSAGAELPLIVPAVAQTRRRGLSRRRVCSRERVREGNADGP